VIGQSTLEIGILNFCKISRKIWKRHPLFRIYWTRCCRNKTCSFVLKRDRSWCWLGRELRKIWNGVPGILAKKNYMVFPFRTSILFCYPLKYTRITFAFQLFEHNVHTAIYTLSSNNFKLNSVYLEKVILGKESIK